MTCDRKWEHGIRQSGLEAEEHKDRLVEWAFSGEQRSNYYDEALCKGEWGCGVPANMRFRLCVTTTKKFVGTVAQLWDETKWVPCEEMCAVDIVRGYTNPYWGYYGFIDMQERLNRWYEDRIAPFIEAKSKDELARLICRDFSFFRNTLDDPGFKFSVLEIEKGKDGNVRVVSTGERKTLAEHQADLRKQMLNYKEEK